MPVIELFSKRAKKARGEVVDVYQYDEVPVALRNQIMMIVDEIYPNEHEIFSQIVMVLRKEYGVWQLIKNNYKDFYGKHDYRQELYDFVASVNKYEKCLDCIELLLKSLTYLNQGKSKIAEANHRMLEAGLGYEFSQEQLIRIDNKLLHQEAVKPAIHFLNKEGFEGAREEFLEAFEDYKRKEYKDSVLKSAKALESTMKSIFKIKGWEYDERDTASKLVDTATRNGLLPSYLQNNLATLIKQSVPVVRNKVAGHGQGAEVVEVPEELVSYTLHMTASTILFLVEGSKRK